MLDLVSLRAWDGCNAAEQRYEALICCDADSRAMREQMKRMSGCALCVRGWLRLAGLSDPILEAPYRVGRAVADVFRLGAAHGRILRGTAVEPGDIVCVGGGKTLGGTEHVFVVLESDGRMCTSVDGGQLVRGRQGIRVVARPMAGDWIGSRKLAWIARI
jgi:hypothetical protein